MCGIAGYIAEDIRSVSEQTADGMRKAIRYRGLDDEGRWSDGIHAALLHTRLSIIDLAGGHQPMIDESGRFIIVFNGEIYNYLELRSAYLSRGARFLTASDTEAILEGYKLKGPEVCRDLNGMFAFAIWDIRERTLFLARDRMGKKPLYWCVVDGVFYFSSSLNAFFSIPRWDAALSHVNIAVYNNIGGFPEDRTVYAHARALPYASYCLIKPGAIGANPLRYWRMDFSRKSTDRFDQLLEEYESILTDAISIRLRSDMPLSHTFSGGVDSGTIAAIATNKLHVPLHCHTIDYHTEADESEETVIARKAASHLGLPWRHIQFDYHADLLRELSRAYANFDEPCTQMALVYSLRLYEAIKPIATVVLSGNGADELFTGYIGDEVSFRDDLKRERIARLFGWSRRMGAHFDDATHKRIFMLSAVSSLSRGGAYFMLPLPLSLLSMKGSQELYETLWPISEEALQCGVDSHMDYAMFVNLTCATKDSNYRLPDISGLSAQVEVRSPYLDYRMVEFAARLPHKYKIGDVSSSASNKFLPKKYYERVMPREIAWSRKKGMGWNLRWGRKIITDAAFRDAFSKAYDALDRYGIDSGASRQAWHKYVSSGGDTRYSGQMMGGFMLAAWLGRNR